MTVTFKSTELFNYKRLQIIHDNWDEMPEDLKDGSHHIGNANLKLLVHTYLARSKKDEKTGIAEIPVTYKHSKLLENFGRQYAVKQLSLQSLTRKIRHTITHDIYNDIDMKNAHLSILSQYCQKKGWNCSEIKKSVENNELYLKSIMEADNVSRGEAKRIKLMVSYGSYNVTSKAKWFPQFKEEIKDVHQKMIKDPNNKDTLKLIVTSKGKKELASDSYNIYNADGKLCGNLMCDIENRILMSCMNFLKNENISTKNVVLCFDGFMIKKEIFNPTPQILEKMSEYAFNETGYKMIFTSKPQDEVLTLDGLTTKESEVIVVQDDADACNRLLEEMKGNIFSCKSNIYVKAKDSNIWTNNDSEVDREIVNTIVGMNLVSNYGSRQEKPYSKDITGVRTLLSLVKYLCPKDDDLIETIRKRSKGKLFFKNGVYDFSIGTTGKFRSETDYDMTPIRINRDYPQTIDNESKEQLTNIINSIFETNKQSINMLQHGARGLAGCIEDKDFVIGTGLRDCGKGILTQLFTQSFGVYATECNANNFITTKRIGTSDEAKNRMWIIPHMWSRLLFANECDIDNGNEKAIINGVLIKSLVSGGDVQKARMLYKSEIEFIFNGRLMMFMNDLPEIKPVDATQHMTLFEFPHKFIMPSEYDEKKEHQDLQPYERRADPQLKEKLKDHKFVDAFIHLVLENYLKAPVENTKEVADSSKEYRIDAGDELLYYRDTFDYSDPKAFTPSIEIYEEVNKKYPLMSQLKIKSFLTKNMKLNFSKKRIEGTPLHGFLGIKIKNLPNGD